MVWETSFYSRQAGRPEEWRTGAGSWQPLLWGSALFINGRIVHRSRFERTSIRSDHELVYSVYSTFLMNPYGWKQQGPAPWIESARPWLDAAASDGSWRACMVLSMLNCSIYELMIPRSMAPCTHLSWIPEQSRWCRGVVRIVAGSAVCGTGRFCIYQYLSSTFQTNEAVVPHHKEKKGKVNDTEWFLNKKRKKTV